MNRGSVNIQDISTRDSRADRLSIEDRLDSFKGKVQTVRHTVCTESSEWHGQMEDGMPIIDAAILSPEIMSSAMRSKGLLLVRNFIPQDVCEYLCKQIDLVLDKPKSAVQTVDYYRNPPSNLADLFSQKDLNESRMYLAAAGSAMCVESASISEAILKLYEDLGLKALTQSYFDEPPCISAKKWVLRRIAKPITEAGWHQDGAFMGHDISSLNMWLALNHCGADTGAPGLEIIPKRLKQIYSAQDGDYKWSAGSESIQRWFSDSPPVCPEFQAGDALFFDHYNLHRTQYHGVFRRDRYAIESWFFGEKSFPQNQIAMEW